MEQAYISSRSLQVQPVSGQLPTLPLSTKSASDLTDADFVSLLSVLPVICHLSGQMQILFSPHWQDTGKTFRSLLVWQ